MTTERIQTLTLPEVAKALRVSVWTVRREIERGKLKRSKVGHLVRVRVSELERYLEREQR